MDRGAWWVKSMGLQSLGLSLVTMYAYSINVFILSRKQKVVLCSDNNALKIIRRKIHQ